ncbi:hypothetical protein ATN96_13365 [Companilactobacillus paralimentarius]|nr:hypothetical protein ATN96_13365 [Companilactobacillus paralimentarius]
MFWEMGMVSYLITLSGRVYFTKQVAPRISVLLFNIIGRFFYEEPLYHLKNVFALMNPGGKI